jgi:GWxTD domain-containing protein
VRRFALASLLAAASSIAFAGSDCLQLFLKAKEQFRMGTYAEAIATLDRLQAESEQPGNEASRAQLAPGLAFYRGACLAALGKADEARSQFALFLTYQPDASLDPAAFSPKVLAAFEEARRDLRKAARQPAETGSLAASYRAYQAPVDAAPEEAREDWADGPVRYLLTSDQKKDFERLSDPVSRSEFIAQFWKARDPRPETVANEAREEFERRAAFADAHFAQDEKRGSMTDRGMVFVLLGPPTWVGRKPLATGEDRNDPKGMSLYTDLDLTNALKGTSSSAGSQLTFDRMTGPGTRVPDSDGNYREVWHYRRELLPAGVSFHQVDLEFISKKGYGRNVLQREPRTLATLETAREALRAGVFSRTASR